MNPSPVSDLPGQNVETAQGSLAVFNKGITDYDWWQELTTNGIFCVTRLKDYALVVYFKKRPGRKA